jgi:RNA polymerase sigma-70 factor (ECF subfamily)
MNAVARCLEQTMEQDHAALAAGLRSGDPEVIDDLIERYQHRLFRYLISITGHRATAEDLFQETWLRVLERGHQYRGQWKFENWLFGIARHLAIDLARRRQAGSLDELMDPEGGPGFVPSDSSPSPYEQVLAGEDSDRIARGLARLAPAYREVLVLRFQEALSLQEIADIIRAPLSTIKSRLYRGLEALRHALESSS